MRRIAFLALVFFAGLAQASEAKPLLLVASPALQGLYSRTALIAVPAGEGHLGFIVNRATDVELAPRSPLYFGGPESLDAVFAIVRRDPGVAGVRLFGELYVVSGAEAVKRAAGEAPGEARYFAGFVGWQPGELAAEIDAGFWGVAEADPALFFRRDIGGLWEELVQRQGELRAPQRGRLSV